MVTVSKMIILTGTWYPRDSVQNFRYIRYVDEVTEWRPAALMHKVGEGSVERGERERGREENVS